MVKASPPYAPALDWTSTFHLSATTPPSSLTGDKLILPQSALESLLSAASQSASVALHATTYDPSSWDAPSPTELLRRQQQQQQLPEPLMFDVVNVTNGKSIHAGVREFSADEGSVILSSFLKGALEITDDNDIQLQITSRTLPKGTHVRLRPLEAGYDEDWKSLLEDHLRKNFTTLTINTTLSVSAIGRQAEFRFLVDKLSPNDAICVVDTDLEVDIEPLDEEQARESLKRLLAKKAGSSTGGVITLDRRIVGTVAGGSYVQYKLSKWDKSRPVRIELDDVEEGDEVDILVWTNKFHKEPSLEEWEWADLGSKYPKTLVIKDDQEWSGVATLQIAIHRYTPDVANDTRTSPFSLFIYQDDEMDEDDAAPAGIEADNEICSNCKQSIPKRTMFLHQNFCFRNNILCPRGCGQVFKRGTEVNHWHCDLCSAYGSNPSKGIDTHEKHICIAHTPRVCESCSHSTGSLAELAQHHATDCPSKLILCQFCHLILPQEAPTDPNHVFLTSLTPHESHCGSRTTNCHICGRITQLKNLSTHIMNHDHERKAKPLPILCRNASCSRTVAQSQNPLDLCTICFGPLYAAAYDPTHTALARRVERKLLTQLLTGCSKPWCRNTLCKTGRSRLSLPALTSKEAMETAKPLATPAGLTAGYTSHPLHFCVDESTQKRRSAANSLSMMDDAKGLGGWSVEWCVKAVESVGNESGGDEGKMLEMGKDWLEKFGVRREE